MKINTFAKTKFFLLLAVILSASIVVTSCKKDDDDKTPPPTTGGGGNDGGGDTDTPAAEVFFIENSSKKIQKLLLADKSVSDVLDLTDMLGVGLAYDAENKMIYFSDFWDDETPNGRIWKVKEDGSGLTELANGIDDPYGIALDKTNNKIYWVDDAGNVSRINTDGTGKETLVTIDGGWLRAIDLDVANNKMYIYEVLDEDLYVANLDGSNLQVLISDVYGYGLKVDAKNGTIYFDDQVTETLIRANLDGTNLTTIDDNGSRIYGIDIDYETNELYWSGRDSGVITKSKLDGSDKEVLTDEIGNLRGMFIK